MCRSVVPVVPIAHDRSVQVQLHAKLRWPRPREPATEVTPIVQAIAYRAERCLLTLHPLLFGEPISSQAVIAEGARAAPAIHAWPKQKVFLTLPWDSDDLHGDRCSRPGWCACGSVAPGVAVANPVRGRIRGHVRPGRGVSPPSALFIAARFGCERIIRLEPFPAIVAEHGRLPAPHLLGRGHGAGFRARRPRSRCTTG